MIWIEWKKLFLFANVCKFDHQQKIQIVIPIFFGIVQFKNSVHHAVKKKWIQLCTICMSIGQKLEKRNTFWTKSFFQCLKKVFQIDIIIMSDIYFEIDKN